MMKYRPVVILFSVLFFCVGTTADAVERETSSGNCGAGTTWTLNEEDGLLTVEGSGDMEGKCEIPDEKKNLVKAITISSTVKSIASEGFSGLSYVSSVNIEGDELTQIGELAFINVTVWKQ